MTTWLDLQEGLNNFTQLLRERGDLGNGKDQSEDSDQDSTPTPEKTTTESKATPGDLPVGVMFLSGRPKRKKS